MASRIFRILLFAGCILSNGFIYAQPKPDTYSVNLSYYLPSEWQYTLDSRITTPEQYLGFQLGSQHVEWNQVVGYMQLLSEQSKRISIKTYGHTYEHRPLICLQITSPQNQDNLEYLRKEHLKVIKGEDCSGPVVTCVGNSIHGNEPSGVQGAIVVAYFLAAAQGADIDKMLNESIILLIPGFNPDGINRFASWVNTNRNFSNNPDIQSREFSEAGPASRLNHYWHDCNRDWLFLEHPEARFGVKVFHEWLPNVMSDHHEMGSNGTFFFSPGHPLRVYDQLPEDNQKMTGEVSKYIKTAFDKIHSKYYSLRGFDDYYIGKGAAYGDVQGSVCLLCEQASSRGHYRNSANGLLTFPFTIRNQVSAQCAIIYAAWKEKKQFQEYMLEFYRNLPQQDGNEGILFTSNPSKAVTWHFLNLLHLHHINVFKVTDGLSRKAAKKGTHYFIPYKGNNPALVHSIMDAKFSGFGDSVFYDISAWTIPLAYNIDYHDADSKKLTLEEVTDFRFPQGSVTQPSGQGFYTFRTTEFYSPALIYALQNKGARLWVNDNGTIYAMTDFETIKSEAIRTCVDVSALSDPVDTTRLQILRQPHIAIINVDNKLATTLGTYWYLLDYRFQMKPTIIDAARLHSADLNAYNTIIIASTLPKEGTEYNKLLKWVENGGTLVCANNAHSMLSTMGMESLTEKTRDKKDNSITKSGFPGGILQLKAKQKSPLSWGISTSSIPAFKNGTTTFAENKDAIYNFGKKPLSGYFAPAYMNNIGETPAVLAHTQGKGRIIYFNFSICFRSYFYATAPLFSNAILFGQFCR
jgi:hypothetical protein